MSMDPNRWVCTLPTTSSTEANSEKSKLDPDVWVNTIPKINTSKSIQKYSLGLIVFVIGIFFVTEIKNKTRTLEKEINNLQTFVNEIKLDLHQATLEHEFVTSPSNISQLSEEHLELNLASYKKSQIKKLSNEEEPLEKIKNKKISNKEEKTLTNKAKLKIAKKIKEKKDELKKLQIIYKEPRKLPGEIKSNVAKKIKKTKKELKNLYSDPKGTIDMSYLQKWSAVQLVKVFLGIPIIPGK